MFMQFLGFVVEDYGTTGPGSSSNVKPADGSCAQTAEDIVEAIVIDGDGVREKLEHFCFFSTKP